MSRLPAVFVICLFALTGFPSQAQDPASSAAGRSILTQSLNASGVGVNVSLAFTANGTITYFWGGEQVQGSATMRAKGHDQFRLDANLPEGMRSVALNRRAGDRKDADGKLTGIPYHNTLSMGIPSLPYASIAVALSDPMFTISYLGPVESGGKRLHQVRVVRNYPKERDPEGVLAGLSRTDYFVDTQTFLVSKTEDATHPIETVTENYSREVELEGYTAMSGVAVPTMVREKVGGQTIWEFRLSSIAFDTSHTDADFSLR
jgi:hypothetical protein